MKKTSYPTEDGVREIVRDELARAKPEWIREITEALSVKFDKLMTMIDKVMGELQTTRQEQTLMSGRLSDHTDELENLDIRMKKLEHPAL